MKIKYIILSLGILPFLGSCGGPKEKGNTETGNKNTKEKRMSEQNNSSEKEYAVGDTQTTPSGLKIVYKSINNQPKPANGDVVQVHYKGTLENGTEFDNSFTRGNPISFPLGTGKVIKGWDEGVSYLGKGDKATLLIPSALAYGERSVGNGLIPANSNLVFDVELVDFKEGYKPFDITGKDSVVTPSGLKFFIIEEGDLSKKPQPGNTAVAHYAGFLENGTKFDASYDRGQPFSFPVGQGRVIKGWDEVVQLMGIGSKYRVVIPSALGYGAAGQGPIPPNSTLIFDMELLDIK